MKAIGVFINCLLVLVLGFLAIQIDLSLFKWTPFGYEPDGLQFVGLVFIFGFLVIAEFINLRLFKGCSGSYWVVNAPFYLAIAVIGAVSFPALLRLTIPYLISVFGLACYFIYGVFKMGQFAFCLSKTNKFMQPTWLDYVAIVCGLALLIILAYMVINFYVR